MTMFVSIILLFLSLDSLEFVEVEVASSRLEIRNDEVIEYTLKVKGLISLELSVIYLHLIRTSFEIYFELI